MINKQYSISCIRLIALLLIVTSHVMKYFDFVLSGWLVVGVQIFLCISGYLYGTRDISDIPSFVNKRLKKVLIPYFITFIAVAILQFILVKDQIDLYRFLGGLVLRETLVGGEHLWFIPIILICYAVLVLLDAYKKKHVKDRDSFFIFSIIAVIAAFIVFHCFSFGCADRVICFVIGYCLGVNDNKQYVPEKLFLGMFLIIALLGNGLQIYYDCLGTQAIPESLLANYGLFIAYNHVTFGITIFILLKLLFEKMQFKPSVHRFLDISDEYSYETYLVHQFVILGPLSLMNITPCIPLNLLIVISVIIMSAFLLKLINDCISPKAKSK